MISDINQIDLSKRYTYADYLTWEFTEMVELIRGKVFRMSPAPNTQHQRISRKLVKAIERYIDNKSCELFYAPFDVRLPLPEVQQKVDKIDTVVQPDVCVICDPAKIDERGCNGAPDWIIEILSKGTAHKDLTEKFNLYEHAGVREYWIVRPYEQSVSPFVLDDSGVYQSVRNTPFVHGDKVPVSVFQGFEVDLLGLFGEK